MIIGAIIFRHKRTRILIKKKTGINNARENARDPITIESLNFVKETKGTSSSIEKKFSNFGYVKILYPISLKNGSRHHANKDTNAVIKIYAPLLSLTKKKKIRIINQSALFFGINPSNTPRLQATAISLGLLFEFKPCKNFTIALSI